MALNKREIELLADKIAVNLLKDGNIRLLKDISLLKGIAKDVLEEDADKEKEIDAKTKELLRKFSSEIEKEGADSSKLFIMTKKKVAKKEGFLL
ncbi:DUF507 family protein [Hippea maritima]|uniref:DUF507 family protein n=1 Tax=Hippea maritima (strain ATCC 700847 / DSM 10411 / MH2) TaxID=760142 RepID=F2LW12_HIPMA|nr:DUF507 family protein [Hippea maritima]AEA33946.1 protein of unknown function DUF507 [Hippea maritima DSM 10411]